jgi:hypothetical protein
MFESMIIRLFKNTFFICRFTFQSLEKTIKSNVTYNMAGQKSGDKSANVFFEWPFGQETMNSSPRNCSRRIKWMMLSSKRLLSSENVANRKTKTSLGVDCNQSEIDLNYDI